MHTERRTNSEGIGGSGDGSRWFVVKTEPCQHSSEFVCDFPPLDERCFGCRGDGSRLDVSSAIPVEQQRIHHALDAEHVDLLSTVFVPVSSTEEHP